MDTPPTLLERNFLVGYIMPAFAIVVSFILCLNHFEITLPKGLIVSSETKIEDSAVFLAIVFFVALLLLTLNFTLIRALEGYYCYPRVFWSYFQRRRFRRLQSQLAMEFGKSENEIKWDRVIANQRELAYGFPHTERFVLPTRFGNTVRAFEVYSRVMYGIDSIPSYPRLLGVIPTEYRDQISEAKSNVDLWVNVWASSIFLELMILYCIAIKRYPYLPSELLTIPAIDLLTALNFVDWMWMLGPILVSYLAVNLATTAAVRWGEQIKGGFDLYLPELARRLGLGESPSFNDWRRFGRAILLRDPSLLRKYHTDKSKPDLPKDGDGLSSEYIL